MLARKPKPNASNYVSDRVFNGTRPLSPAHVAKLRANYHRTHSTMAVRFVAQARRLFGLSQAKTGC